MMNVQAKQGGGRTMDLTFGDLLTMQRELQDAHPEWGGTPPGRAQEQLLWALGEMGEVIDIFKKRRLAELQNDPSVRRRLIEELADVQMYLADLMLCLDITPQEYAEVHCAKHAKNMKRDYAAENLHMFDGKDLL